MNNRIIDLGIRLDEIAGDRAVRHGYWLRVDDDANEWGDDHIKMSVYEGNDYCWDCIQTIIKLLRLRTRTDADDYDFMVCDSSFSESDTVPFCAWCEAPLAYILTDHGIAEEQAHFLEGPPTIPLTRNDAYSLARALDGGSEEGFLTAVEGWLSDHAAAIAKATTNPTTNEGESP